MARQYARLKTVIAETQVKWHLNQHFTRKRKPCPILVFFLAILSHFHSGFSLLQLRPPTWPPCWSFVENEQRKKEKKRAKQWIPPSYFSSLYAAGYHMFGKTVEKHTPAHLWWLGWEKGCSHELSLLLLVLFGASAVGCRPNSQVEVTQQGIWSSALWEYREGGTCQVLPYQCSEEWGLIISIAVEFPWAAMSFGLGPWVRPDMGYFYRLKY